MLRKIWVIARRELYETYTDTNLLMIMIATPLVLATIIGLALGGTSDGSGFQDIPVAIVNQDAGDQGDILVNILVPGDTEAATNDGGTAACRTLVADTGDDDAAQTVSLEDLLAAEQINDVAVARAGVEDGTYAAAIIVPPDFSERVGFSQDNPTIEPVSVEIYADPGQTVSATIIRSITDSIVGQIARGNIAVAATIETLTDRAQSDPVGFGLNFLIVTQADAFEPDFNCAFDPGFSVIGLEQQTVRGKKVEFDPLVYFGSAQAMFFLLFTAQGGAISILEDKRQGVLQRLIVSPTPRTVILLGKLFGTFISALAQLVILFVAFTVVGSLIGGGLTLIWGTNWLLIAIVVIVASLSVSGLGTLLASLAKTPEQANIFGSTINIAMGAVGGAFFAANQIPALQPVQWFSLVYWGQDAFTTLSAGGTEIWLNVVVMLVQGAGMFLLGLWIFGRRLDV